MRTPTTPPTSSHRAATTLTRPTNNNGGYMQYFLFALLAFGVLSMTVNIYSGNDNVVANQMSLIESFKEQHFVKSNSKYRKHFAEEPEDDPKELEGIEESEEMIDARNNDQELSELAGLNCDAHGGPKQIAAQEMVYWEDIDSDNAYLSPFMKPDTERKQYMTFESDHGGWNNVSPFSFASQSFVYLNHSHPQSYIFKQTYEKIYTHT
jgi:hypothetical protein